MASLVVRQMNGQMERPEDQSTDTCSGRTGGWMDRWMNRQMDGQLSKQAVGWTDRQARLTTDRQTH